MYVPGLLGLVFLCLAQRVLEHTVLIVGSQVHLSHQQHNFSCDNVSCHNVSCDNVSCDNVSCHSDIARNVHAYVVYGLRYAGENTAAPWITVCQIPLVGSCALCVVWG